MYSTTDADICFDNTSFYQLDLEADKIVEPELPPDPEVEPETPTGPGHTEGEELWDENGWVKQDP